MTDKNPNEQQNLTNEEIKTLIRQRSGEIKEKAENTGWKYGGVKECDNCSGKHAWLFTSNEGQTGILCPDCGFDTLDLDWRDITKPLP